MSTQPDQDEPAAEQIEPCRVSKPGETPALPGSQYAAQAFRDGSEDDYSDRMRQRYGGEW
jgi:hypothetical protein